ncbi:POC1 centriolar protein homolog A-like [Coccinella septempunctata]|uniref:POC1 centriolar protein homolog A-like n=1 Tax=Coccinella septempunctata TaxID=41139 RepID=UPI001D09991E|nr:POC1 centriolar protein homolog A-like [Coccinella septempunctata]
MDLKHKLKKNEKTELMKENDPVLKVVLKGHRKPISDISFFPDVASNQFATGSEDGTMMIWDTADNTRSYNYIGHSNAVTGVEYSPDGRILGSCSVDHTVRFWAPRVNGDCSEFKAHLSPIHCLNFSEDCSKLITGARDKAIKMWDVSTKHFISSFLGHNHWVKTAKFFPDGRVIASGADDRTLRLWDVLSGKCIHSFVSQDGNPVHVAPYPNNNSVAVAMSSGAVRIYELRTRKLQQHYVLHTDTTYVSWHPHENYLLTCGKDGKVRIVDVEEGRPIYTLGGHDGEVTCAKFSANGEYFATGGGDNLVMVWKTNFIDS